MNKIQIPQEIIYRKLRNNNPKLIQIFSNYLEKEDIQYLIELNYFKYSTNLFKKYYNFYKPLYQKNQIHLSSYLQKKQKDFMYFIDREEINPNIVIEYLLPNLLLILICLNMTNHNSTTTISF